MKIGKYDLNSIYNLDCYEAIKDIPDNSIDLILTDPPYLIEQAGGGGCFGDKHKMYHAEYSNLTNNENISVGSYKKGFVSQGFDLKLLDEFVRIMKKINIYIWCNKNLLLDIMNYFNRKNCMIEIITWHKTNCMPTCNNNYCNDTEFCVFARERGVKIYGSMETKHKYYVTSTNKEDKKLFAHPTIKPLEIIKNLVINSTQENEIVLDCFLGSGTTAVACKETNRNYLGFEINNKYFIIAKDRLNGITKTGQTSIFTDFEQLNIEI